MVFYERKTIGKSTGCEVRLCASGYYALYVDGVYRCTTHETDRGKATRWMNVFALQRLAVHRR
ncbi:hypothetical protein [Bradyrhizobium sp. RT5a]|uniref:hypothetical protein n=1 Tax=Bradyrhizobium sp. RT5a TaxID=3156380 RepID=UPI0033996C4F